MHQEKIYGSCHTDQMSLLIWILTAWRTPKTGFVMTWLKCGKTQTQFVQWKHRDIPPNINKPIIAKQYREMEVVKKQKKTTKKKQHMNENFISYKSINEICMYFCWMLIMV